MIQKSLQDPLATMILEGRLNEGDTATVAVRDGALAIETGARVAEAA